MVELPDKAEHGSNGGSRDLRVMALVHGVSEMPEDARAAFLDSECGRDSELRRDVELILAEGVEKTSSHVLSQHLGAHLPEHYKLIGLVGAGGMAEVFLAEDTRLNRRVAIKFLNDAFRRDPERMRRFDQEARAASALNHPNILTIHDIGEADGVQYIVSEFVDGETLGARIGRSKLPAAEAVEIAIQIASALNAAHAAGIVHRDLKPDNIMLRADGTVKVVDFGLAKSGAVAEGASGQNAAGIEAVTTSPGIILGTPRYMSPEQTRGMPLDGRSDIFSLGIIIFEMLAGRSPFGGNNVVDVIANILSKEPRHLESFAPETPQELVGIVHTSLQKEREKRYAEVGEMLVELKAVRAMLIGSSQSIRETRSAAAAGGPTTYFKWIVASGVTVAVLVGVSIWFGAWRSPLASGAMRSVSVTSWSTVSAEPMSSASFSPNASMVAFASTKSGVSEVWAKPTTGGDAIQATKNGFYNQHPVWSADGQEIAYFSSRGEARGLWKAAFTGGQESQLVGGLGSLARPIRWTDSRLFYRDGSDVFDLDLASGARRKLTDLGGDGFVPRAITVSPDGSSYAISIKEDGVWKVKTRRFGGPQYEEIAVSESQVDNVAFHPNGRDLFFTGGVDGTSQIFIAGPGSPAVQISSGNDDLTLQDVAADGAKVLYNSVNETSDLWSVSLSDGKESVIANDVTEEYWPAVSPDGKLVAYQSVIQPDKPFGGSIFVKPLGVGNAVQVAGDGFSPVWSDDGLWVAFFRRTATEYAVWKVRPNGADAMKLVGGEIETPNYLSVPYLKTTIGQIGWSPDNRWIAFAQKIDGIARISTVSLDGSESNTLMATEDPREKLCCVMWNQNGSQVALASAQVEAQPRNYQVWTGSPTGQDFRSIFTSAEPFRLLGWSGRDLVIAQKTDAKDTEPVAGSVGIWSISSESGMRKTIANLPKAYFYNIHLSQNGQSVAYASRSEGASEIWSLGLNDTTRTRVVAERDPKILFSTLVWSPDGRSIIYGKQTRTNVLSMLTN